MVKHSPSIIAASAVAVALMPMTAFAYLSPEQVFGGQSMTLDRTDGTTYQAPPQQREGEAVIQNQQQNSAALRSAAQSSLQPTYAEPEDNYVPEKQDTSRGLLDQNATYERRMDRMAEESSGGPTIIIGGDGTVIDSEGNVLHSGAPLVTATGPESVLAVAAMILAAICTMSYAWMRERQLHAVA